MFSPVNRTHPRRTNRGQTLVEVTLIIPLLLVLVGAALDWGLVFFVSHVVQNAVRSGARVAVTLPAPTVPNPALAGSTIESLAKAEVQRLIPNTPLFSGFRNSATIVVNCSGSAPPFMNVQTTGTFSFYFMRLLGLTTTTFSRDATMKYERDDTNCPSTTTPYP